MSHLCESKQFSQKKRAKKVNQVQKSQNKITARFVQRVTRCAAYATVYAKATAHLSDSFRRGVSQQKQKSNCGIPTGDENKTAFRVFRAFYIVFLPAGQKKEQPASS